jgi:hypothetical protein
MKATITSLTTSSETIVNPPRETSLGRLAGGDVFLYPGIEEPYVFLGGATHESTCIANAIVTTLSHFKENCVNCVSISQGHKTASKVLVIGTVTLKRNLIELKPD